MNSYFTKILFLSLTAFTFSGQILNAQEKLDPAHEKFFEAKIRPALIKYCYECHSVDSGMTRGGLLVDTRDGLLQGGESGPAIDPEEMEYSPLWSAINYEDYEMPPSQQMPDSVIADFKTWFDMGAPDPRVREKIVVTTTIDVESGKSHWAFKKPEANTTDSIEDAVAKKQESLGTTAVPQADPETLLRRLSFDLNGLPPSIDEVKAFAKHWKTDPQKAIENKVDELLARTQYGERWGRHWMDVARYAESTGNGNFTYPHAWRYRDFVIDAFNKDTPYDKFIEQQLAGDLMPIKTDQQWQENLIATGFLTVGIKDLGERNPRIFEMELIDEQIDTTTQAFLGLTVSCARCHDHKFDPIPTVDYYALAGVFKSTDTYYGTVEGQQNHQPAELLALPLVDAQSTTTSFGQRELQEMRDRIQGLRNEIRTARSDAQKAGAERPEQRKMVALRNQIARLEGVLKTVDENGKPYTFAMGAQDGAPVNANVLLGGDVEKQAQQVERGFLQVLSAVPAETISSESSGRRELAKWIASKENPLTARVMVNRIWMHLIGEPLMISPNNWGLSSQPPFNAELLDQLAVKFMDNDWSVKSIIREIVLSDTYQRASAFDSQNYEKDPDNKSLWRAHPRQLDAESLRDALLAVSSLLKTERPLASEVSRAGDVRFGRRINTSNFNQLNVHRSVYLPIVRDALPESLSLFDFADPNATNSRRESTNVPSQSLYLMNSDYVSYVSQTMAIELSKKFRSTEEQVRTAFLATYGRPVTKEELGLSVKFFKSFKPVAAAVPRNGRSDSSNQRGTRRRGRGGAQAIQQIPKLNLTRDQFVLAAFCQSLMASAEFRILN